MEAGPGTISLINCCKPWIYYNNADRIYYNNADRIYYNNADRIYYNNKDRLEEVTDRGYILITWTGLKKINKCVLKHKSFNTMLDFLNSGS